MDDTRASKLIIAIVVIRSRPWKSHDGNSQVPHTASEFAQMAPRMCSRPGTIEHTHRMTMLAATSTALANNVDQKTAASFCGSPLCRAIRREEERLNPK